MIRLRVRLKSASENTIETYAIANTGFIGREPEVVIPKRIADGLNISEAGLQEFEKTLADGTLVKLKGIRGFVEVYAVTEDRIVGPINVTAYIVGGGYVLLNDKLLDELGIVIIAAGEGLWCFKDEMGARVRRSV